MFYDRKIKYLDYIEDGERQRGAGFVKMEARDERCKLAIQVQGLYESDTFSGEMFLSDGKKEEKFETIQLQNGRGALEFSDLNRYHLGSTAIGYDNLVSIRIPIGTRREVSCVWRETLGEELEAVKKKGKKDDAAHLVEAEGWEEEIKEDGAKGEDTKGENTKGENTEEENAEEEDAKEENAEEDGTKEENAKEENTKGKGIKKEAAKEEKMQREDLMEEVVKQKDAKEENVKEEAVKKENAEDRKEREQKIVEIEEVQSEKSQEAEGWNTKRDEGVTLVESKEIVNQKIELKKAEMMPPYERKTSLGKQFYVRLKENKWQQLSALYPHIKPFEDEREYLSIGPADFVVFPEKYYRRVNNSFLLHGYYNYEHLILTRTRQRGEVVYYIGVPGNFYDKEKQVAVMFGFESFECREEPACQGDFGYYMMRLEL